jgi:hypothetical protein
VVTQERLKELFAYDALTGLFIRRKAVGRHGRHKALSIAGTRQNHGYTVLNIDGRRYMAHRLAWLYFYGRWPDGDLDHINEVKDDNRISNLREATRAQNMQNVRRHKHNTSGYKGVSWMPDRHKWRAYIFVNYKQQHIGLYNSPEEARDARRSAETRLHSHRSRKG